MIPTSPSMSPRLTISRPVRRTVVLALAGLTLPLTGLGCRNNACMTCGGGGGLFSRNRPIFLDSGSGSPVYSGGTIGDSLSVPGSSGSSVISEPTLDPSATSSSTYGSATPSSKSAPALSPLRDDEIELKPLDEDDTPPIPDELPSFDDLKSRSGDEPSLNPSRVNGASSRYDSDRRPAEFRQPTASAGVPRSSFSFASQRD